MRNHQPNTVPCPPQTHEWMPGPTPNSNDICRLCGWKRSQEATRRARDLAELTAVCTISFHVFSANLDEQECVRCGRVWCLEENDRWAPHGGPLPSPDEMLSNLLAIRDKLND